MTNQAIKHKFLVINIIISFPYYIQNKQMYDLQFHNYNNSLYFNLFTSCLVTMVK